MKLLLDTCIWGGAADELRMRGHDVGWSGIEVIMNRHGKQLEGGAVITVEPGKIRIRPPDIDELDEGNATP
jgi:hypothetical protein